MRHIKERRSTQLSLLLPALYAYLAPSRIPDPDDFENLLLNMDRPVLFLVGPIFAFDCILALQGNMPVEASMDFWPRIWTWIHFIDTNLECFQAGSNTQETLCSQLVHVLTEFLAHKPTERLIEATPGVGFILGKAWVIFLSAVKASEPSLAFRWLSMILGRRPLAAIPRVVEELWEGAGGSVQDLAELTVKHIEHFVAHADHPDASSFLSEVIKFIVKNLVNTEPGPLHDSLCSSGLPAAVARCLVISSSFPPTRYVAVATNCVILLGWAFSISPGYPHLREALNAGFLRGIVAYVSLDHPKVALPPVQWIFREILPRCTVYHSVLAELQTALRDVMDVSTADTFSRAGTSEEWDAFIKLSMDRLSFKDYFDSDEYESFRACDNTSVRSYIFKDPEAADGITPVRRYLA